MEISDIQFENGKVVITFCSTETYDDILEIKISKSEAWKIHDFCREKISYAAELREEKRLFPPTKTN